MELPADEEIPTDELVSEFLRRGSTLIPDDIREKAWKLICGQSCNTDVCSFQNGCGCFDAVSVALLAERERAAKIAESANAVWEGAEGTAAHEIRKQHQIEIAAAIRSQP